MEQNLGSAIRAVLHSEINLRYTERFYRLFPEKIVPQVGEEILPQAEGEIMPRVGEQIFMIPWFHSKGLQEVARLSRRPWTTFFVGAVS